MADSAIAVVETWPRAVDTPSFVTGVYGHKLAIADRAYLGRSRGDLCAAVSVLPVKPGMAGGRKQDQILQSIVAPVSVDVVDVFMVGDGSSQVFTHHQSVFRDVSVPISVGVGGHLEVDVTLACNVPPAFPKLVPSAPVPMTSNIADIFASLDAPQGTSTWFEFFSTSASAQHDSPPSMVSQTHTTTYDEFATLEV